MDARELLAEVAQVPAASIAEDAAFEALQGLDSLKMVRLMLRLEQELGRELTEMEMQGLSSVSALQALLGPPQL